MCFNLLFLCPFQRLANINSLKKRFFFSGTVRGKQCITRENADGERPRSSSFGSSIYEIVCVFVSVTVLPERHVAKPREEWGEAKILPPPHSPRGLIVSQQLRKVSLAHCCLKCEVFLFLPVFILNYISVLQTLDSTLKYVAELRKEKTDLEVLRICADYVLMSVQHLPVYSFPSSPLFIDTLMGNKKPKYVF